MGILIRNGHIVDALSGMDETADLYLDDGFVKEIGKGLTSRESSDRILDAEGRLVMPGIVDLHVHFRDPGQTQKEDIESGSRAAARGGVTTVVAMPNTTPVIDSPDRVSYVQNKAAQLSPIRVFQAAALSLGQKGEELSDLAGLAAAGVRAFSEDGRSLMNARLMRDAMRIAAEYDIPILDHCEDIDLRGSGCMNEDENAKRLGLPGICNAVEDTIAGRDILLARDTGARLHLCHCSTEGAAFMMKLVKQSGNSRITAEVCPHHLLLTSDDIPRDDPNYKMNPPLRTRRDVDALLEGLRDGSIDVISTDHAPHTAKDKSGSMRNAAFGIVGLETSLPLIYTGLVEKGILTLGQMIEKMCLNPARILGVDGGTIAPGHRADVLIVDTQTEYEIDKNSFVSKGKNTPFHGWKVKGKVKYTICNGKVIWEDEK